MIRALMRRLRGGRRQVAGPPRRDGFSLVEIMIVMVILAIGVIPIAVVQHHARREVVKADLNGEAIALAQSQIERYKGLGFGNLVDADDQVGRYVMQTRVVNVSFGLDRVDVTVNWNSGSGPESLTVSNLVSMR